VLSAQAALRRIGAEYVRGRRTSGEVRSRLVAVAQRSDTGNRDEIERVRASLERSLRVTDDRTRALESVISALAAALVEEAPRRPKTLVGASSGAPLRGGWMAPNVAP
jgi:hypothetical protein